MQEKKVIKGRAYKLRNRLVDKLIEKHIIKTKNVEQAFRKVYRHLFVHNETLKNIYGDYSIVTKKIGVTPMSSSSSPSLMAMMLEMAALDQDMRVLEIGTGTGYNAAIISEIVGNQKNVFSIDIDRETINEAEKNLAKAGYPEVTVKLRDGIKGLDEHAPYDRIIVTCSAKDIPQTWINQLKHNGIIVVPLCFNGAQVTAAFKKENTVLRGLSTRLGGFMNIRKKTFEEIKKSFHPSHDDLLIVTEHPEYFTEEKVISLLLSNKKNRSHTNFKVEDIDSFLVFLALYENRSVDIYPEDNVIKKYGFERGIGIIDTEKNSGCLITTNNRLTVYGKNRDAYNKILKHMKEWNNRGCPTIDKLKIIGYYKNNPPSLKNDEVIFCRPSVDMIVKIPPSTPKR